MPLLSEIPREHVSIHMLLCADTKGGKSDYVAHAILAGYHCIYIDADHGINTVMQIIGDNEEAKKRVIYIPTQRPYEFLRAFFVSSGTVFRWNLTRDKPFTTAAGIDPTDMIVEIKRMKIPLGFILSIDSWSTAALQALQTAADKNNVELDDMGAAQRLVYSAAGWGLTEIGEKIQKARYHVIVHAHSVRYEVKEKAPGQVKDSSKESAMIIKETLTIPNSSSGPHGIAIASKFNEIAWFEVDGLGNRLLSFDIKKDRIGGGSKTGKGDPRGAYSFVNLFGKPISFSQEEIAAFYREYPVSEYVPANPIAAPKPATTAPAAAATGNLPKAGILSGIGKK